MSKKKQLEKVESKETIIKLPISKFINTKFRDYAIYIIESRGIPSFYDMLTPIQRFVLQNTPTNFVKTLTVVGSCIGDGYHHGDASLQNNICRMTRPYANSLQLLEGYGFFGTEICPEPSAPRYTSTKLSSYVKTLLSKYSYLNTRVEEGSYDPFYLDIPIGLAIPIVGIAIGYKTLILPRNLDEVQKYLNGDKKANLDPYFKNFNGSVTKLDTNKWLCKSLIKTEDNNIHISNLVPIIKYASIIKRLNNILSTYEDKIKILNNSKTVLDITVKYNGNSQDEFKEILNHIDKTFSVIITEKIIMTKDSKVLEYESISEYLDEWKWNIVRTKLEDIKYKNLYTSNEIEFNKAKIEFINFMLKKKRTIIEVDEFYSKYNKSIVERLDRLSAKHFTTDELDKTTKYLKELEDSFKQYKKDLVITQKEFDNFIDPTLNRGNVSKRINISLFNDDDVKEENGYIVWDGLDELNTSDDIDEI